MFLPLPKMMEYGPEDHPISALVIFAFSWESMNKDNKYMLHQTHEYFERSAQRVMRTRKKNFQRWCMGWGGVGGGCKEESVETEWSGEAFYKMMAGSLQLMKKHIKEEEGMVFWAVGPPSTEARWPCGCIVLLMTLKTLSNTVFLVVVVIKAIASPPNVVIIHRISSVNISGSLCISWPPSTWVGHMKEGRRFSVPSGPGDLRLTCWHPPRALWL